MTNKVFLRPQFPWTLTGEATVEDKDVGRTEVRRELLRLYNCLFCHSSFVYMCIHLQNTMNLNI